MRKKITHTRNQPKDALFNELSQLIEQSQQHLVSAANSTLTMLFWQIGQRINANILQNKRAHYGKQIVVTLSRLLEIKYGNNFEEKNLRRMMQFAQIFSDVQIVVTLSRQLSWSHFISLIPLKKAEARLFYAQKAAAEGWGVRELRESISRKEFERTAIAHAQLLPHTKISGHNIFKDPYFLEFLGLKDAIWKKI